MYLLDWDWSYEGSKNDDRSTIIKSVEFINKFFGRDLSIDIESTVKTINLN
jgi:hypothetical protein